MSLPNDYLERVYAGVLGKIIGVYLGRPFEGWSYERIMQELGEIWYYVHQKLNKPLIVADDDISGTFTFVRALADHGDSAEITAEEIGHTWLNYIIENKSILWWGGMGNSTEHTAFLRLKQGIPAPRSGSMALNSKVVSEQIGAQIFIDGWAIVAPNDPALAVELAGKAGSVSHDGEALYGAQMLAAMEASAFGENDLNRLLDVGLTYIPSDSVIATMIQELRALRLQEEDWREAFKWLREHYGYHKFGGGCHMVPNHGLMILSLLWGEDDFQKTLMICNTCGWDTDCNSGNIGCLMGIKLGLEGIDSGPDWRGPVADRFFCPTADGGSTISDAVTETYQLVNSARRMRGLEALAPKDGGRFHFSLPGSLQGFEADDSPDCANTLTVMHTADGLDKGRPALALQYDHLCAQVKARAASATFLAPQTFKMEGYSLTASPTLYPGQTVNALVKADEANDLAVECCLYYRAYALDGSGLERFYGPSVVLQPGERKPLQWQIIQHRYQAIAEIGVELRSDTYAHGTVYLDYLTWDGAPQVVLIDEQSVGNAALSRPWVNAVDWSLFDWNTKPPRMVQNTGRGMAIQGTRAWQGYRLAVTLQPHLAKACGAAVHVQGLRRYYAFLLCSDGFARLMKMMDKETVLAEMPLTLNFDQSYDLVLQADQGKITAWLDGKPCLSAEDHDLVSGAVALITEEGNVYINRVEVTTL